MTKQEEGKLVYSMTAIIDLSFPGQRTATATLCIPHDSVYMPGPRADTWLQIFQNDSKICEAEVKLTPLINKICKPWNMYDSPTCINKVKKIQFKKENLTLPFNDLWITRYYFGKYKVFDNIFFFGL